MGGSRSKIPPGKHSTGQADYIFLISHRDRRDLREKFWALSWGSLEGP